MTRLRWMALAMAWMVAICWPATAANNGPAMDEKTGVKVGAKAPNFKLKASDGKEYALDELTKKGKVAVVFFRAASW